MESFDVFRGATVYLLSGLLAMYFTKSYTGIVRHTGMRDGVLILKTISLSAILVGVLNFSLLGVLDGRHIFPFSVLVIASVISLVSLITYRLLVKQVFQEIKGLDQKLPERKVLIYGAGEAGSLTQQAILKDSQYKFITLGFLDDEPSKRGKKIEGKPVFGNLGQLDHLVSEYGIQELIIAILNLSPARKREIIDKCISLDVRAMTIPPVNQWVGGGLRPGAIRDVKIEDLLGRDSITLENQVI